MSRAQRIVDRVLALGEQGASAELANVDLDFSTRHRNTRAMFERRFLQVGAWLTGTSRLTSDQAHLIGAYFCHEYSYEAAALFNPSIVLHPDQATAPPGGARFVMALRGVGEGHISSITFRTGTIDANANVSLDPPSPHAAVPTVVGGNGLEHGIVEIVADAEANISECVVFPVTPAQSKGIEDVRLTRFVEDDSTVTYYGTYTAYSGAAIASEMLSTEDFHHFKLMPLVGDRVSNKGMALFPRRIDGKFAMLGRYDNENLWYLTSSDLASWSGGVRTVTPCYPWEFVQIGNCGAPMEIDEGWLVMTHGVGPMRNYAIGACLLDKKDPSILIGRTPEPLIRPEPSEREGYVPNVVYTCGGIICERVLILPYAIADTITTFATMPIDRLLAAMV
ncbi:glycoside hydrolase family 130 protein [Polymorphobacter megasporae]|nr:glycoside hydrolase family 130 protein [Polymorphobacter megasporae]